MILFFSSCVLMCAVGKGRGGGDKSDGIWEGMHEGEGKNGRGGGWLEGRVFKRMEKGREKGKLINVMTGRRVMEGMRKRGMGGM